jgi:hypothetical protein
MAVRKRAEASRRIDDSPPNSRGEYRKFASTARRIFIETYIGKTQEAIFQGFPFLHFRCKVAEMDVLGKIASKRDVPRFFTPSLPLGEGRIETVDASNRAMHRTLFHRPRDMMKYAQSDLLKKSLLLLLVLCLTMACSTAFAQESDDDAVSPEDAEFTEGIKTATGLPFPFFIAVVFLPTGIGIFVLCMSADRRVRDKEEEYKPTRLAETLGGEQQIAPQGGAPARMAGGKQCKEAKSALTLGIVAFLFIPILGIPAILTGLKAKKLIAQDRRLTGEGAALAGIILGFVALAWGALMVVIIMSMVVSQ